MLSNSASITSIARRFFIGTGLAIGLAACSQGGPQVDTAAPVTAAPVTTVIDGETISTEPASDSTNRLGNSVRNGGVTEVAMEDMDDMDADDMTEAPAPKPIPVAQDCLIEEFPPSTDVFAISDLNVRRGAGTHNSAIGHLVENEIAEFAFYADNDGCVYLEGSGVWWAVWLDSQQTIGWSHSNYLAPYFPDYVEVPADEVDDVHFDCVFLSDGSCITVTRNDDGTIGGVFDPVDADQTVFAQIDCVYYGDGDACDLLTQIGLGDNNFGLGNSLTQIPTEDLINTCSHDIPANNPHLLIECEELFAREGGI